MAKFHLIQFPFFEPNRLSILKETHEGFETSENFRRFGSDRTIEASVYVTVVNGPVGGGVLGKVGLDVWLDGPYRIAGLRGSTREGQDREIVDSVLRCR